VPNPSIAISTALGTGNVFLEGGTLRTTSMETGRPLTINVGGNYTQGPGGTLALGIGGLTGSQYDRGRVGGNATLSGTLRVFSLDGFHPSAGDDFAIERSNGSRSGIFTHLDDSLFNKSQYPTSAARGPKWSRPGLPRDSRTACCSGHRPHN